MNSLEQKLSRIDLNLLVSLSVLLKERNVSRAADTLFLSQPAMSRTLQRLRDVFDDPLFYRTSQGISPTAKAEQLEKMLPDLLESLAQVLTSNEFDPKTCDDHFAVSIPSLMGQSVVLSLFQELAIKAPKMNLSEYPAKSNPFDLLESGTLDFAIHLAKDFHPAFTATPIGKVNPVIYGRKNHPLFKVKQLKLSDCMNCSFLGLIVENDSNMKFSHPVDALLTRHGVQPRSVFRSSQIQILTDILKSTDALLIGMNVLMKSNDFAEQFSPLYAFELDDEDVFEFVLLEHKRTEKSPAHQWFKEKLLSHIGNFS
ncbi:LysR family transcriptional regulator [Thalassotalea sp. ND16A]|uniref:LysR family transcriptional regulator n=1 Tax=Thalassotalea sp. ND16A TaxID=1535422 RepID=UPI000519F95F|nr:LysR family transcriptional regulator [Thalassotalea sp. ND16A]KGJ96710.1 hypothetical protein ND16A_1063 [Thalassotalea sp. ND16A]